MSIYSGFATRHQQKTYDSLLYDLFDVLQRRIIKFYTGQEVDQHKFHGIINSLHGHLSKMQENKYLEPKFSCAFKDLLAVTTTVNSTYLELQKNLESQDKSQQVSALPKQSLSFSRDKMSQDIKGWGIGKIKHQINIKDQFSSRKETNPEDGLLLDKKVKRAVSTHFPRNFRNRKQYQRKGVHFDSYFNERFKQGEQQQKQKKNMQYVIREYVSKGLHKRNKKRPLVD